ncbi:hypothetical protein PVAP13_3NG161700, partial [Panicum virgatum]
PIDYTRHAERMVHEYAEERTIRLVLSKEQETAHQVSITPLKRPRQQPEDEEHPFMDDPFDAFKDWLANLQADKATCMTSMLDDFRDETITMYKEWLRLKGHIPRIMTYVEKRDTDGITSEVDESNGSNATPTSNWPSHARKKKEKRNVKDRTQKLPIEFSSRLEGPVGPNYRTFVDEVALFTRKKAPLLGVNSWKDIKENVKNVIAEEIL